MKAFSLGCVCGCPDPLIVRVDDGNEAVMLFRSEEAAQLAASDIETEDGEHPLVIQVEIRKV